jgi:polyhydroxyalkanoate synthesis regulator protein
VVLYVYTMKRTQCLQIAMRRMPEYIEEILHPAALESRTQISEDIDEMRTQLQKQVNRLRELAERKIAEPGMCPPVDIAIR